MKYFAVLAVVITSLLSGCVVYDNPHRDGGYRGDHRDSPYRGERDHDRDRERNGDHDRHDERSNERGHY